MAVRAHVENAENAQEGRGPRMPDQRHITRKIMNGNPTTHVTLAYGNARHARGKKSGNARYAKKKNHPLPQPPFITVTIPNPRSLPTATHVPESRWEKRIAGNAHHLQQKNSGNARRASLKRGFGILKTVPPMYLVH
jgi:hypothetical protein